MAAETTKAYYIVNPYGVIHSVPREQWGAALIQKNARYRWATSGEVKGYKRKAKPVLRVEVVGGAPADVNDELGEPDNSKLDGGQA